MTYRPTYGDLVYGTGVYGVTGAVDGRTGVVSFSSYGRDAYGSSSFGFVRETGELTVTTDYKRIRNCSASVSATSSTSSACERVREHSPTVTLQTVLVQIVEEYAITDGARPGYGLKRYGINLYGRNDSTEDGSASIAATSSATASCERVREHSKTIAMQSSTSARGVYSILVNVTLNTQLQTSTAYERIMNHSGSTATSLSLSVPAIEKWEPVSSTPEIWTPVTWSRAA